MAYEDYWKEDGMDSFSDDTSTYYDEELGFYDDFGEKIDSTSSDLADDGMDEPAAQDEPADGTAAAAASETSNGIDRDFRETLETDDIVADQLDDPSLQEEAAKDYPETQQ